MIADLKLLRNFAVLLFKASVTIPSYRSSAVFCIALMCGGIQLKLLKNQLLNQFYHANYVN